MAYVIRHNNPSVGYISWQNLNMQYNGVSYAIADGYTDKIYTWWAIATPYVLQSSNTFPTLTAADALVLLNKNGTATLVPGATILDGALIVPGTIMAEALSANSVTGEKILAGEIDTTHLAAGAVTASTVAADAIGAAAIAAGAIQTDHLSSDVITTDKIVAEAITTAEIASETILATNIASNAITADKIAANAITAVKIDSGAITTEKIAAGAITAAKLDVTDLSAITANLGTVTSGEIDGAGFTSRRMEPNGEIWMRIDSAKLVAHVDPSVVGAASSFAGELSYTPTYDSIYPGRVGVDWLMYSNLGDITLRTYRGDINLETNLGEIKINGKQAVYFAESEVW